MVLLDEPTSGLDEGTEGRALKALAEWAGSRTLVIVTHRPQVLEIVHRIVVIEAGRVLVDGPKAAALETLAKGVPAPARPPVVVQRATPSTKA